MNSKIWIINLLLVVLVCLFLIKTYDLWTSESYFQIAAASNGNERTYQPDTEKLDRHMPSPSVYKPIVAKNLFSPDRSGLVEKGENLKAGNNEKSKSPKDIVLYGVMIRGGNKQALISNPDPRKESGESLWVKVGEKIKTGSGQAEVTVEKILKDRVVLEIGGETHTAKLYLEKKPKGGKDAPQSAEFPLRRVREGATPLQSNQESSDEITPDGKYRIIETPFGKIKRRIN